MRKKFMQNSDEFLHGMVAVFVASTLGGMAFGWLSIHTEGWLGSTMNVVSLVMLGAAAVAILFVAIYAFLNP